MIRYTFVLFIFLAITLFAEDTENNNANNTIDIDSSNEEEIELEDIEDEDKNTEKVKKYLEKLESKISLQLTNNPNDKPLTLTYVIFKISKRTTVPFLRDKTRDMVENIEDIELSRINANQMRASSLLNSIVASRGLEVVFVEEGFFLRKKERKVLTEKEREKLKEQLELEKKNDDIAEAKNVEETKCSKCKEVVTSYLEKKREYCSSCWKKKNTTKKRKVVVPKSSY